jgi:hypothetical protein
MLDRQRIPWRVRLHARLARSISATRWRAVWVRYWDSEGVSGQTQMQWAAEAQAEEDATLLRRIAEHGPVNAAGLTQAAAGINQFTAAEVMERAQDLTDEGFLEPAPDDPTAVQITDSGHHFIDDPRR